MSHRWHTATTEQASAHPFGKVAGRHARLMPDRRPAMTKVVRVVVRHPGEPARPSHRWASAVLGDSLEHLPLGNAILEWTRLLDGIHEPLREVHPTRTVTLRR